MLKQTITYVDFNGEEQTEDFYFNLTKAEAVATELSGEGNSFSDHMDRVVKAKNGREIIRGMQEIIKLSYGERSIDGARFAKSPEILERFTSSNAYSELFMKLATNAGFAAEFANGIMPTGLDADLEKLAAERAAQGNTAETPSQVARRLSEERLQGHKPKTQPQKENVSSPQVVPGPSEDVVDAEVVESSSEEMRVVDKPLTAEEIDALPISEEQKARLHSQIGE